jgi:hypothetical protein
MTKISNTGPGGLGPTGGPESTENLQGTEKAKESNQAASNATPSESATAAPKPAASDTFAKGDLKAAGERLKQQLDAKLEKTEANTGMESVFAREGWSPEQIAEGLKHFAPPYVPVGPVVRRAQIDEPGQVNPSETSEVKLTSDQFQITKDGNLVITNEKLIEYFKSLKENAAGQDIHLGLTKMKPPTEE